MSNDKTPLADVQPGGRVRLGDQALSTSEGARQYVADFFATQLRRHGFRNYITTRLAADFACALAQYLASLPSPTDEHPDIASWSKGYHSGYARALADHAARQPVGQERVARASTGATGHKVVAMPGLHKLPYGDYDLYAAPPAQQPAQVYLDGLDRALGEAIDQRDRYHEVADELADHIARITGVDIGEHSSANCPWQNAIEAAEAYQPAQAVDLGQMPHGIRLVEIPRRNGLDPINVFVQDYELGRGRIVVTCYGQAWCGFWGAMGERTVMQFVAACDADYVAGNMLSGRHEHVKKHERAYVERIATEVIAEFRALLDSQEVGNG